MGNTACSVNVVKDGTFSRVVFLVGRLKPSQKEMSHLLGYRIYMPQIFLQIFKLKFR